MSDSELSSAVGSEANSPAASPERPAGNRYDAMFGSDNDSDASKHDDDGDDDVGTRKRSRKDAGIDEDEEAEDDDLFGDDDRGDAAGVIRGLDEEDVEDGAEPEPESEPERFVEVALPRHPAPGPGDDQHLYLMKIPSFLGFEPVYFDPAKFVMPEVQSDGPAAISAYTTATTTVRVRKDPNDPTKLQSNARIIRWNDGSLSLQVASSPNMWDLPAKDLAPDPAAPARYDPANDSHTYILDPHESASTLRVIGHATKQLKVQSASGSYEADQSVQKLQNDITSALNDRAGRRRQIELNAMKDPEAMRKEAEKVQKEKDRAAKKLENQRIRQRERDPLAQGRQRYNRVVSGTRSKRDSPPIGGGRLREDNYDLEDDFIEGSDEEPEVVESSEEEEEFEERYSRRDRDDRDRKRRRVVEDDDDDDDDE